MIRVSLDIKCLRISSSGWKIRRGYVTVSFRVFEGVDALIIIKEK